MIYAIFQMACYQLLNLVDVLQVSEGVRLTIGLHTCPQRTAIQVVTVTMGQSSSVQG